MAGAKKADGKLGSRELLDMSEISLILDTYDDIFTDFDPRPFHSRALSQDFLDEAKRASIDKEEGLELNLMMPRRLRSAGTEDTIRKRLHEHFKRHHSMMHSEIARLRKHGIIFLAVGVALMSLAYVILSDTALHTTFSNVLFVILEPAGWFTTYTGLERIFNIPESKVAETKFYGKMAGCSIRFTDY